MANPVFRIYFEHIIEWLYLIEYWIFQLQTFYIVVLTLILDAYAIITAKFSQIYNVILEGHKIRVFMSATGLVKEGLDGKTPDCACT